MKSVFGFERVQMTPGKIVKAFRTSFGITVRELSEATGIEESNLTAIENDRRDVGLRMASKLGAAFGLPPEMIMFPEGYKRPKLDKEVREVERRTALLMATKHSD